MSTLAYGTLTRKRNEADPEKSTTTEGPGVRTYIDTLAALVPAEILALHATILTFTTSTDKDEAGQQTATITEPTTLKWVFWALLATSVVLYVLGLSYRPSGWGWLRIAVPPLAFVAWTLLQNPSAFDAVDPGLGQADKAATAIIGAIVLAALAAALAAKADKDPAFEGPPHRGRRPEGGRRQD